METAASDLYLLMLNKKLIKNVQSVISVNQAANYINQLDLTYIVTSMCSEHYPLPRWIQKDAEYCCQLYKNFLLLLKKYSEESLVPSREIDEFWHNHILYTRNYTYDCMNIFGHYLHHDPSVPNENAEKLTKDYQKTKEFYFKEFNHAMKPQQP